MQSAVFVGVLVVQSGLRGVRSVPCRNPTVVGHAGLICRKASPINDQVESWEAILGIKTTGVSACDPADQL